jgi:hypothetical protein
MDEWKALAAVGGMAAVVVAAAHWAAPRLLGRRLRRLEAYGVGVAAGLWLPVAAAAWLLGTGWWPLVVLVAASLGAGAGTLLAWWLDRTEHGVAWVRGVLDALLGGLEGSRDDDEQDGLAG